MLGEKLKELRGSNGLLQRQVAAVLEVDTALISKMENNEKLVSRNHLKKLALLFKLQEEDLLILWLAEKVYDLVKDEDLAIKAMKLVEQNIILLSRK